MELNPYPNLIKLAPYLSEETITILKKYGNRIYAEFNIDTMLEGIKYIENHQIIVDDVKSIIIDKIKKIYNIAEFEERVKKQAQFFEMESRWNFILDKYSSE
jgi:hypothetical protein